MSLPPSLQDERVERATVAVIRAMFGDNVPAAHVTALMPEWRLVGKKVVAALSTAQADAEVERLRNALRGLLNAQTSRERAYATVEAQAALSEERPQVSDRTARDDAEVERLQIVPMPTMRAAFRTTESGPERGCMMVFRFPSMEAMHRADDEWRAYVLASCDRRRAAGETADAGSIEDESAVRSEAKETPHV